METRRTIASLPLPKVYYHRRYVQLDKSASGRKPGTGRKHGCFESAFTNAPIGSALVDMEGRCFQVNDSLCRIMGHAESELKATALAAFLHPEDVDLDVLLLRRLIDGEISSYQVEKRGLRAWGQVVWMMITVSLVRDDAGRALYQILQFQDISESRESAGRIEYLADHDFLTGLLNRRCFERELAAEIDRAARYGSPGTVLLIDLDNFKTVNDTFGHMAGDDLLKEIAGVMKRRIRHTDILGRVGGDEFAVLLTQTDTTQAIIAANDIVAAVAGHSEIPASQSVRVTASVGVASLDGISAAEALARADSAMYGAKQAGRNRAVVYKPLAGGEGAPQYSEADWIRKAIADDRFLLYWQPILDLRTNEVCRYELLLRLPGHEGGELLAPNSFLYVAERFGLITAIDCWVVRKAILLIAAGQRAGQRLLLNVNLSGKSIDDPGLAGYIEDALAEIGIDPSCLVFELTEAAAITNVQQTRLFAERMHGCGCQIALDNVGAGIASFYYLKNLTFDYLKIDGEFIRHLGSYSIDHLVVQAIVGIAKGMGKKTVAEFVTDADAVCLLRDSGVDYAQGYHIGLPQPVAEFLEHSL